MLCRDKSSACPRLTTALIDPIEAARLSPSAFARYATQGRFSLPRHLALLERVLVEVAAGRRKRVAVSVPPRHGKSWLVSRYFPAWFLGHFPDKRIILASYEADFAAQWGRDVRDLLAEHGPTVFGVCPRSDSSAANRWGIDGHEGGMQTAGVGGPVLGKGADVFLIDDPIKNYEEAFSETIREKIWNWYRSTAHSRLEPGGSVVIVQQRSHQGDLIGKVIGELDATGIERWDKIVFPALAMTNDVLGRKPGEALWPERYPADVLRTTQKVTQSLIWSAFYQQDPTPEGGQFFKREDARRYRREGNWIVYLDTGERHSINTLSKFVTCDTATTEDEDNDFTATGCWGSVMGGRELVLLDASLRHIEAPEIDTEIRYMTNRWQTTAWIEESSPSKNLLQFLRVGTVGRDGRLRLPLAFRTLKADTDKRVRAIPASALMQQGRIVLPVETPTPTFSQDFLGEYEKQLFAFPSADHDDAVDMTSYAAQVFAIMGGGEWSESSTPEKDAAPSIFDGYALPPPRGWP